LNDLTLKHPAGETGICVGTTISESEIEDLSSWIGPRTAFLITSGEVWRLHGEALAGLAARFGDRWHKIELEDGEAAKSIRVVERVWRTMIEGGGRRDSRVISFGGGSIGDLAGFAAGGFLRGVDYVQIPTTLLAQVDAAIGGKTGINLPEAKNSVGLFHHPHRVLAATSFLRTLPAAEIRSGLVEVVKMAYLLDPGLFERLELEMTSLLSADPETIAPIVAGAAAIKVSVVEQDPTEKGIRKLLNFGHTLGHAIEGALDYETLRHGEAVAYGMLFALQLSERRGLARAESSRLRAVLVAMNLPPLPELDAGSLLPFIKRDKKNRAGRGAWVLASEIGRGVVVEDVVEEELLEALAVFLDSPWSAV